MMKCIIIVQQFPHVIKKPNAHDYVSDINECANTSLNTCQHGACFNLFGNYSCICGRGWEGNHCQSGEAL